MFSLSSILLIIAVIWLLAVYKVFILDDGSINAEHLQFKHLSPVKNQRSADYVKTGPTQLNLRMEQKFTRPFFHDTKEINFEESMLSFSKVFIHHKFMTQKRLDSFPVPQTKKIETPNWPPVLPDGSFPLEDGYDIMPITQLKVPKFWVPPENIELEKVGSRVNEQPTIFLMIASYRDFQCRETISSAFMRADHPERLFIGAVDQVVPGDVGCLDLEVPCSVDSAQPICRYRDQISVYKMDAATATGPVTARHIGDRMYRGQYYVMQMDAHCLFVRHWDSKIIQQFERTGNEMAVLRYLINVFLYILRILLVRTSPTFKVRLMQRATRLVKLGRLCVIGT